MFLNKFEGIYKFERLVKVFILTFYYYLFNKLDDNLYVKKNSKIRVKNCITHMPIYICV